MRQGSYYNGFAPRDGQPRYPSLWHNCVGAWGPCLGPSGLTLYDWSGFKNHGTITNADLVTSWAVNQGRYALTLDGSNDYVRAPVSAYRADDAAGTITAWVRTSVVATFPTIFSSGDEGGVSVYLTMAISDSGTLRFLVSGANVMHGTSAVLGDGKWHHVAVTSDGSTYRMFVDGRADTVAVQSGSNNGNWFSFAQNRDNIAIGALVRSSVGDQLTGSIDDVRVYSRPLKDNEIRVLSQRRGIAYELEDQQFDPGTNRRRRVLIGA